MVEVIEHILVIGVQWIDIQRKQILTGLPGYFVIFTLSAFNVSRTVQCSFGQQSISSTFGRHSCGFTGSQSGSSVFQVLQNKVIRIFNGGRPAILSHVLVFVHQLLDQHQFAEKTCARKISHCPKEFSLGYKVGAFAFRKRRIGHFGYHQIATADVFINIPSGIIISVFQVLVDGRGLPIIQNDVIVRPTVILYQLVGRYSECSVEESLR